MQIGEISKERKRWKKIKKVARMQRLSKIHALRMDQQNLVPVEERVEKSVEPRPSKVFTGAQCEYIRLNSLLANEGCTNGE